MAHKFAPLARTGKVYCENCGVVGRNGGACRGHRPHAIGSTYLAAKQLRQDWRSNQQGYAKHYGGGKIFANWVEASLEDT